MSTRQATVEVEVEITWTSRKTLHLPPDMAADGSPYVNLGLVEYEDRDDCEAVDIQVVNVSG